MSRKCDYKMYRLPHGVRRRVGNWRHLAKRIHCDQPATRFFKSTHAKMLKTHPTGQWLCVEHYKDQKMMQELFEHLDTPEGKRDLFGR